MEKGREGEEVKRGMKKEGENGGKGEGKKENERGKRRGGERKFGDFSRNC